ncbi:uncharacterized protein LOC132192917 isoform X2 [Neocloeon triangulifer]|uniref:uncharacterized protein LOC132192917 isoform X2 n=1 Tax=Neocloeon triangulifer TaxID=2078957 RepID=UPI00286F77F5|nr:uncharacterized protein LOC132192917 isoform X2 [Neocloeon triangulifer]
MLHGHKLISRKIKFICVCGGILLVTIISQLHKKGLSFSSTCSLKATNRGPHQFVVSFSYFGENDSEAKGYFEGISANAHLVQKFYPGWVIRVYHDISQRGTRKDDLDKLEEKFGDWVDFCFVGEVPGFGNLLRAQQNMWRYLTLSDPLVDFSLFRDLDSFINDREEKAVRQWLAGNYALHIMRDNPYHGTEILGGMWGARMDLGHRKIWSDSLINMLKYGREAGELKMDQEALGMFIWPHAVNIKGFALQHDSYFCENPDFQLAGKILPFPTCRNESEVLNFVGSRRHVDKEPMTNKCPEACRLNKNCTFC